MPTGIPRTKRHTPVQLLYVLKIRKIAVSSVDARELGCWSLFQISALGVIGLLKSGRSLRCEMAFAFAELTRPLLAVSWSRRSSGVGDYRHLSPGEMRLRVRLRAGRLARSGG